MKFISNRIPILQNVGNYQIKTATSWSELQSSFRLRHQVFFEEAHLPDQENLLDCDVFDEIFDHLIIQDLGTQELVGTYRLNASLFSDQYYCQTEFILAPLLEAYPGVKVELGRACIHPNHRNGQVISLLWRGISLYMMAVKADLLFGATTVLTEDPQTVALVFDYLDRHQHLMKDFIVNPREDHRLPGFREALEELRQLRQRGVRSREEEKKATALMPPLMRSYLRLGALFGGEPAWDPQMKCVDFLTILPRSRLSPLTMKKYFSSETTKENAGGVAGQASGED